MSEFQNNNSRPNAAHNVRRPVVLGLFVGTTVGLGFLLAAVPNVELMTLVTALAGVVLGARLGFVSGGLAMGIYSLASPYGMPHPILLLAQVLGMGLAGIVGHTIAAPVRSLVRNGNHGRAGLLSMLAGLILTLGFDMATYVGSSVAYDLELWVMLATGGPLFLFHLGANLVFFGFSFPLLVPRVALLAQSPLSGRSGKTALVVLLVLCSGFYSHPTQAQTTVNDSTLINDTPLMEATVDSSTTATEQVAMVPLEGAALAYGWKRPLWEPFAESAFDWLNWYAPHVVLRDGGVGAMTMILGEGGTSPYPVFLRDGIPLGTGHVLTDDPGLIPMHGLRFGKPGDARQGVRFGRDGWGGTGGSVALWTDDFEPGKAVSIYSGVKGPHETYLRSFVMRSPRADWRFTFDYEENIDNGGYNYTTSQDIDFFPNEEDTRGHGKIRMGRGRISRFLDDENRLSLEYSTARKTKDEIPVLGAEAQEIWSDELALDMGARLGPFGFRGTAFWINRDVQWGSRSFGVVPAEDLRKIESSREGLVLALSHADTMGFVHNGSFKFTLHHWRLDDTGPTDVWSEDRTGNIVGDGLGGTITASGYIPLGGSVLLLDGGGYYDRHGGWMPGGMVTLANSPTNSWWEVSLASDGRAPRSDELFTPQRRYFNSNIVTIFPNADLGREKTQRANVLLAGHSLGLDLALDASIRRLTDGIMWQDDGSGTNSGYLGHGLEMVSTRITAQVSRQGRFLGWGTALVEGTYQSYDETAGQAAFLPPEQSGRMELKWENHFFKEDGILQLALLAWWRAEMADPWDVSRQAQLPAVTSADLILGFRLLGANLSIGLRNLTGQKVQLTSNSWSTGQEVLWRLNWTFFY
jgi:hypothetical protein